MVATATILAIGLLSIARLPWAADARLSYDSIRYYAGAESILQDGRYRDLDGRPQQLWPPGMSLLYAALSRVTRLDPILLVPVVNTTAFAVAVGAFALLINLAGVRWWVAALSVAAVAWNGFYLNMQNKLWSEPPSLALFMLTLLFLAHALQGNRRATLWIGAACLTAAGCIMLRYAFLALIPVVVVVAIWRRRWAVAALALLTPLPAMVALILLGAAHGNRSFATHSVPWRTYGTAISAVGEQVFPRFLGETATGVLFVAFGVIVPLIVILTTRQRAAVAITGLALLWSAVYALFLPLAQAVIVPQPAMDLRVLLPLYFTVILAIGTSCEVATHGKRTLAALLVGVLLTAAFRAGRFAVITSGRPTKAPDCISRQWYVDAVRRAAPQGAVGTNAQGAVWLALRRPISTMADADTKIWIDPSRACDGIVDQTVPKPQDWGETNDGLMIWTRIIP